MDSDFGNVNPNPSTVTFNFGNQNQALCVTVPIIDDLISEDDESFYALLSDPNNVPGHVLAPNMARITIIDDDPDMPDDPTMS